MGFTGWHRHFFDTKGCEGYEDPFAVHITDDKVYEDPIFEDPITVHMVDTKSYVDSIAGYLADYMGYGCPIAKQQAHQLQPQCWSSPAGNRLGPWVF